MHSDRNGVYLRAVVSGNELVSKRCRTENEGRSADPGEVGG